MNNILKRIRDLKHEQYIQNKIVSSDDSKANKRVETWTIYTE